MIDVENEIFTVLAAAVRKEYPDSFVTGEYVRSPPAFPCVSIVETDNTTYQRTQSSYDGEHYASVMYEINVYSNKTKGKKAECKQIAAILDEILLRMNFTRTMLEPVPNQDNAAIYRLVGRYQAVVAENKTIFRR